MTSVKCIGGPLDGHLHSLEPGQTEIRYATLHDESTLGQLDTAEKRYLLFRRPSGSVIALEEAVANEFKELQRGHDERIDSIRQKLLDWVGL